MDDSPLWWSVDRLTASYQRGDLSPVEVAHLAAERIAEVDPELHAYVGSTADLALDQARVAETAYRHGNARRLAGVPVSVKDAFHLRGHATTLGSLAHVGDVADADSGTVRRMRAEGAMFVGKTNVSEFCQSATTDNLLGPDSANPWDHSRTPGGSSGGAAASVAAGTCLLAIGSDGGGSIRIPAAFCGLVGLKPGVDVVPDEGGFEAFSPFASIGPLARTAADARVLYEVLTDTAPATSDAAGRLSIGWCAQPEARPVDPRLAIAVGEAVGHLSSLGHRVDPDDIDIEGWDAIFGPLLLAEEGERRSHLLDAEIPLTDYLRRTLEGALRLRPERVAEARSKHAEYRQKVDAHFERYDVLATPATATPAFELGHRPTEIAGSPVSRLWGAFPFAVPFNVSGHPAVVVPVGLVDELPVAIQLVGRYGSELRLLELAAELEGHLGLDLFAVRPGSQRIPGRSNSLRT